MGRRRILWRSPCGDLYSDIATGDHGVLAPLSRGYSPPEGIFPRITHPSATYRISDSRNQISDTRNQRSDLLILITMNVTQLRVYMESMEAFREIENIAKLLYGELSDTKRQVLRSSKSIPPFRRRSNVFLWRNNHPSRHYRFITI